MQLAPVADRTITRARTDAAGGPPDIVARLVADGCKGTGQPVIVDPKPGGRRRARGRRALAGGARRPHAGRPLNSLVSEIPHIVKLRFDMAKEIKPVAELARAGLVMVGTPACPRRTSTSSSPM